MKHLYLIYHVPKTGGQTIRNHLARTLERDLDFIHLGKWDREEPLSTEDVAALSPAQRDRLRSVSGHPVSRDLIPLFPSRTIREVVFLREPAARFVSHYNFNCTMRERRGEQAPLFEEFQAKMDANLMTTMLLDRLGLPNSPRGFSLLLAELAKMWMVATDDSLDVLAPHLFSALGLDPRLPLRSNVTGHSIERHISPTPQLVDEIRSEARLDVLLYEATRRFEQQTLARFGIIEKAQSRRPLLFVP